jgi:phosphohistidine phosphatase
MEIYVLRHAIAVERGSPDYLHDDSQRPLTKKGIRRMRRGVRGLGHAGLEFDLLLTSPYTRARQTAEIVVEALGGPDRL